MIIYGTPSNKDMTGLKIEIKITFTYQKNLTRCIKYGYT